MKFTFICYEIPIDEIMNSTQPITNKILPERYQKFLKPKGFFFIRASIVKATDPIKNMIDPAKVTPSTSKGIFVDLVIFLYYVQVFCCRNKTFLYRNNRLKHICQYAVAENR